MRLVFDVLTPVDRLERALGGCGSARRSSGLAASGDELILDLEPALAPLDDCFPEGRANQSVNFRLFDIRRKDASTRRDALTGKTLGTNK
jgi:hypothetical protein